MPYLKAFGGVFVNPLRIRTLPIFRPLLGRKYKGFGKTFVRSRFVQHSLTLRFKCGIGQKSVISSPFFILSTYFTFVKYSERFGYQKISQICPYGETKAFCKLFGFCFEKVKLILISLLYSLIKPKYSFDLV